MVRQNKGFSLLELMIALGILGVILAIAVPSMSGYMDKRKVIDVAEAVYGQLQLARSESIARSTMVYVNFSSNDTATWAMGVSTNSGCDVNQTIAGVADDCTLVIDDGDGTIDPGDGTVDPDDLVYYTLKGTDFAGVSLGADGDSTTAGDINQISFNPMRGTASGETIYITYANSSNEYEMRVIVSLTGRVIVCAEKGVAGYRTCP